MQPDLALEKRALNHPGEKKNAWKSASAAEASTYRLGVSLPGKNKRKKEQAGPGNTEDAASSAASAASVSQATGARLPETRDSLSRMPNFAPANFRAGFSSRTRKKKTSGSTLCCRLRREVFAGSELPHHRSAHLRPPLLRALLARHVLARHRGVKPADRRLSPSRLNRIVEELIGCLLE